MYLGGLQKYFVRCYHLSCVLASFLGIISKRRNKRESHTTLQTDYFISNVRRWQFFDFDTLVYYRVVLTTKWWKPPKNATFHTFDGCKKFLVGCLTSWLVSKVALHPREPPEKFWGQYNKIKTRNFKKSFPPPETGLLESESLCRNFYRPLGPTKGSKFPKNSQKTAFFAFFRQNQIFGASFPKEIGHKIDK